MRRRSSRVLEQTILPFPELATTPPVLHVQCNCSGTPKQISILMTTLHFGQPFLQMLLYIQKCTGKLDGIVGPRILTSCVIPFTLQCCKSWTIGFLYQQHGRPLCMSFCTPSQHVFAASCKHTLLLNAGLTRTQSRQQRRHPWALLAGSSSRPHPAQVPLRRSPASA